jgi:hypothetical protein
MGSSRRRFFNHWHVTVLITRLVNLKKKNRYVISTYETAHFERMLSAETTLTCSSKRKSDIFIDGVGVVRIS